MALSKKLMTRIVIGVVVAIVILFIIWKFRGRSNYAADTLSTASAGTPEASFYSNLATCQNTFTASTLGSVSVNSAIDCANGTVTVWTLLSHPYTTGSSIYVQGVSSAGTTRDVTVGYNTVTGTPVTVDSVLGTHKYTYKAIGGTCTANTSPTITQMGYSWVSTNDDVNGKNATRTDCITSNVQTYMDGKCPWTSRDPTSGTELTALTAYKNNIAAINDSYDNFVYTAPGTATAGKPTLDMIQAARQADYTGATRLYLSTVCPDYYRQTSGATGYNPASTADPKLPNTPYMDYTGPTAAANTVGFDKTRVTLANIITWAKYASTVSPIVSSNNVYQSGGNATGSAGLISGTTYGTSVYDKKSSASASYFPNMMNWEIAQDVGPGTMTKAGGIESVTTQ
jgi:hypothetical protein